MITIVTFALLFVVFVVSVPLTAEPGLLRSSPQIYHISLALLAYCYRIGHLDLGHHSSTALTVVLSRTEGGHPTFELTDNDRYTKASIVGADASRVQLQIAVSSSPANELEIPGNDWDCCRAFVTWNVWLHLDRHDYKASHPIVRVDCAPLPSANALPWCTAAPKIFRAASERCWVWEQNFMA
ncbi:hypothetical protein E5Q_03111 [Mixia osmundae IAM 14324]|uniref:Uncharacterized protein n=2 Tax=Mixia osmundae (strain CBS 9802 / IAM 14324 / JCM 22182 / KY 12970) TaxID=764103 RepID=G7E0T4_MIXOS|nr:hypothetical protein E5Q_03111 [Mixia osmundae IAM 14324]